MNYTKIYAAVAKKKTIYVWQPNESDQWLIVDGAYRDQILLCRNAGQPQEVP